MEKAPPVVAVALAHEGTSAVTAKGGIVAVLL